MKIHPTAEVYSTQVGEGTTIWQYAVVLEGAVIGRQCNINCHTFIESDVRLGDRVTVKSGVYLWNGLRIEDDVFIGPNATFVNDPWPRSQQHPERVQHTTLGSGCSIGANATILGGVEIGRLAMVGAGSVVTKSVAAYSVVAGNPARVVGWVNEDGERLSAVGTDWVDRHGRRYSVVDGNLRKM
jgi:acetyltransferase-like isoleucine patch superfamily enzyme